MYAYMHDDMLFTSAPRETSALHPPRTKTRTKTARAHNNPWRQPTPPAQPPPSTQTRRTQSHDSAPTAYIHIYNAEPVSILPSRITHATLTGHWVEVDRLSGGFCIVQYTCHDVTCTYTYTCIYIY